MHVKKPIRPIARKLARSILIYATICALAISAVQAMVSWSHVQGEFEATINEISQTHVPLLSVSVWDIEPEAIRRQLKQLASQRGIGFVRLVAKTGQIFEAGDTRWDGRRDKRVFEILQPQSTAVIAELEVTPNPNVYFTEIAYTTGTAFFGFGVLTLMICALVVFVLRRELERPLRKVANFAKSLSPANLMTPLSVERNALHERDEIDLVVDGFTTLQKGIDAHIKNLDDLVRIRTHELEKALEANQQLSALDPLTGCFNRRTLDHRITQEVLRAQRHGRPLSVVFCDIDHFKLINDDRGHLVGDQVLRSFAAILKQELRADVDWIVRYGGEEFLIVLPETNLAGAEQLAERIRLIALANKIETEEKPVKLTASFGVAQYDPGENTASLIGRADEMLYEAKRTGRNRVCSGARERALGEVASVRE